MNLYLVHCGFYDDKIDGIFESHLNLFVTATSVQDARAKARELPEFKKLGLHIDGLQMIEMVQGFDIIIDEKADPENSETIITSFSSRDMTKNGIDHN